MFPDASRVACNDPLGPLSATSAGDRARVRLHRIQVPLSRPCVQPKVDLRIPAPSVFGVLFLHITRVVAPQGMRLHFFFTMHSPG